MLQTVFDKAPFGIALLTLNRRVRCCNPSFARIYGWDEEQLVGQILPIPEHQVENYQRVVADLCQGLPFINVETVRIRKDGSEFYARISGSPVTDAGGRVTAFVASIAVAEENYSEQLELGNLEYLAQSSSDLMRVVDLELAIRFINDPGEEMVEIPGDDEVDGRCLLEFFVDDSRARLLDILQSLQRTKSSILTTTALSHQQTGAMIPVSCLFYLVDDPHTGKPISIGCVAKNVAEQHRIEEAEAAFGLLLNNVPVPVMVVDSSRYPVEVNESLCQLLGYTAQESKSVPFLQHLTPEEMLHGRNLFTRLLSGEIHHHETARRLVRKDGVIIPTQIRASLLRDEEGNPKSKISFIEPQSNFLDIVPPPSVPKELPACVERSSNAGRQLQ